MYSESLISSSWLICPPRLTFPRLITEWRIQKRIEEQFQAFITGFYELIPSELITVFDERELELLIGGIADIDVDDWKKHTDYRGYTEQDEVIKNFWAVSLNTPSAGATG
jgi:E3 ubiquitin-protein ligase NEDD4